ncbi:hypothetical protein CBER1_00968 [Cercospora berteroae]|uniref:HpcH/HpaI aldolase/citrate lyase domain-containing protein n=1 Tax=Cercospora berteroae TaxID=357750 RepID=A0A2S6C0V3_9PEZI|nr:hypothetical protein CBER1_00968 [Cercospora berteroae]
MQAANRLQKALKTGQPSFGGWQMLPGANLSRAIARTPGLDFVVVDGEHGNIADADMHDSVAAIAACGVSPVVRVAEGQHWMIKRALDAGAHGIIVPLIQSVEDAKNIVKYSKFPPLGNRGLGSPFAAEKFAPGKTGDIHEMSLSQYFEEANDSILVIVQIETASALEQIKEIAAIDGIDVCFIGPVDLGNSIGHPPEHVGVYAPELEQAIEKIHQETQAAGKWTGIYTGSGEQAKTFADRRFNLINVVNDVGAIRKSFAEAAAAARK